jgi:hypothetical protein
LENEAFGPVVAVATVPCDSLEEFPLLAARAANKHLFGTLCCTLIWPDAHDSKLDEVVGALDYGAVSVNMWSALTYGNPLGVWGGAPGTYRRDRPQSGRGLAGNALRLRGAFKAVAVSPFVNGKLPLDKAVPMMTLDMLAVLASGQPQPLLKIAGIIMGRCFGLLPRKLPGLQAAEKDENWWGVPFISSEASSQPRRKDVEVRAKAKAQREAARLPPPKKTLRGLQCFVR